MLISPSLETLFMDKDDKFLLYQVESMYQSNIQHGTRCFQEHIDHTKEGLLDLLGIATLAEPVTADEFSQQIMDAEERHLYDKSDGRAAHLSAADPDSRFVMRRLFVVKESVLYQFEPRWAPVLWVASRIIETHYFGRILDEEEAINMRESNDPENPGTELSLNPAILWKQDDLKRALYANKVGTLLHQKLLEAAKPRE